MRLFIAAFVTIITCLVLVYGNGSLLVTSTKAATASNYVTTSGSKFILNNQEFKFVGFNLFDAAASDYYKCGGWSRYSDSELDAALKYAKDNGGATVLRAWAFQSYTQSGTNWSGLDKLIRMAKANGYKLILSLENGPGHCQLGNSGKAKWAYQGDTWYTTGYKVKYGTNALTFYEYIDAIVGRYKTEDAIMAWELVNEPDTSMRTTGIDDCNGGGDTVIKNFAADLSSRIKAIDSNHLVTIGAQSSGACGGSGPDYVAINSVPNIDFGTIHDYGYWADPAHSDWKKGEQDPLPGSNDGITLPVTSSAECQKTYGSRLACTLAYAKTQITKPVVIAEVGISTNRFTLQERAAIYDKKIQASFANGVTGYLVWQLNKVKDGEAFDVQTNTNDPLFAVMKKYAQSSLPQACKADYNKNFTVDLADFANFAQNYKKTGINCTLDLTGDDCFLSVADLQVFASIYKKTNSCAL